MDEISPQIDKGVETMGESDDEQCGIRHQRLLFLHMIFNHLKYYLGKQTNHMM